MNMSCGDQNTTVYTVEVGNGVRICPTPMKKRCKVFSGELVGAKGDKTEVAVRVIDDNDNPKILREIANMKVVSASLYITQYWGQSGEFNFRGLSSVYIVMEKCGENLEEIMQEHRSHQYCCKILHHMMRGLLHIHEQCIQHRNLTPLNVLRSIDGKYIKIAGFGISKKPLEGKSQASKSGSHIGKEGWGSPEAYGKSKTISIKSDIYSGGLIFYYVLSGGRHPCGDDPDDRKDAIESGKIDLGDLQCPDVEIARDLITKMLEREPSKRPTAEEVLKHSFFWDDEKKLDFLCQVSDAIDKVEKARKAQSPLSPAQVYVENQIPVCENEAQKVLPSVNGDFDWLQKMKLNEEELEKIPNQTGEGPVHEKANEKFKKGPRYNHASVTSLLRFIRNRCIHYKDDNLERMIFRNEQGIWKFFSTRFPKLFFFIYDLMKNADGYLITRNCQRSDNLQMPIF